MANRVEPFDVTLPAGTPPGNPVTVACVFNPGVVGRIEVDVPPGPAGLAGFVVGYANSNILSQRPGAWIIADDVHLAYDVENMPTGSGWQVIGYNTDIYDHTLRVRFVVTDSTVVVPDTGLPVAVAPPAAPAPLPPVPDSTGPANGGPVTPDVVGEPAVTG